MKRKVSLSVCAVLMLIAAFISFQMTYTYVVNKYEKTIYGFSKWSEIDSRLDDIEETAGEGTGTKWQEVYKLLTEVDNTARTLYVNDIDEDELLEYVLTGYMYGLGDNYSAYMPKSEYDAFMQSTVGGSMVGIGVRITYDNNLGGIYVTSVMPGTPAEQAGVLPADVIVAVDGVAVSESGYYNAYNHIKEGEEGEPVVLEIAEGATDYTTTKSVSVTRQVLETSTVESRMLTKDIAYVGIYEFDATTGKEFVSHMDALIADGAKKYVFDVRNNPGGTVGGVSEVLDYLLPEGPIIRTVSKNGAENVLSSDAKCLDAPMVVLANENTASAGELFTAALRDYNKATIIGTKTFGKGSMQSVIPLSNGGAIKLSTEMYNPPYSDNYDGVGIVPDKTVELSEEAQLNFYKLTDEEDIQLMSALDELNSK